MKKKSSFTQTVPSVDKSSRTMRITIRSSSNFSLGDSIFDMEIPQGVSMTVPDQTLSLRELIDRYTRGVPVRTHQPVYNGDEDLPDFERLDLVDLDEARHYNKVHAQKLKDQLIEENRLAAIAKAQNDDLPSGGS